MIKLKNPAKDEKISLQTNLQKCFISEQKKRENSTENLPFEHEDTATVKNKSHPLPVRFSWVETKDEFYNKNAYFFLLISEKEDMSNPQTYVTQKRSICVFNLKVGTKYFWCVQKNGKKSAVSSFETEMTLPRCLKIDNTNNVRDLGGYKVGGGHIRQGLLFRGAELELHYILSPQGAGELLRLNIRTELDLRGEVIGKVDMTCAQALGIKRIFIPSVQYSDFFAKEHEWVVKKLFAAATDTKNFPMYFHCMGGIDRTGTLAFILGAFLGMSYEDLICNYEFSSFSSARNREDFAKFLQNFKELPGDSTHEKATFYLENYAKVSKSKLLKFYNTMIEKE